MFLECKVVVKFRETLMGRQRRIFGSLSDETSVRCEMVGIDKWERNDFVLETKSLKLNEI